MLKTGRCCRSLTRRLRCSSRAARRVDARTQSSMSAFWPFSTSPRWNRQSRSKLTVTRSPAAGEAGWQQRPGEGVRQPSAEILAEFMCQPFKLQRIQEVGIVILLVAGRQFASGWRITGIAICLTARSRSRLFQGCAVVAGPSMPTIKTLTQSHSSSGATLLGDRRGRQRDWQELWPCGRSRGLRCQNIIVGLTEKAGPNVHRAYCSLQARQQRRKNQQGAEADRSEHQKRGQNADQCRPERGEQLPSGPMPKKAIV